MSKSSLYEKKRKEKMVIINQPRDNFSLGSKVFYSLT